MEKQKTACEVCKKEFTNIGSHMKAHDVSKPPVTTQPPTPAHSTTPSPTPAPAPSAKPNPVPAPMPSETIILMNTSGQQVPQEDYFYKGVIIPGFEKNCGKPVDREDLLAVFNKVFKPSDNFLFYKATTMEVYLIIVPIKYSTTVGEEHNSIDGDFQKHAISFLTEGSVNIDTLRTKLERIPKFCKFGDR